MGLRNWEDQRSDPENMRAARYYGQKDIRIEDVDEQKCGAGQVRVRIPRLPPLFLTQYNI